MSEPEPQSSPTLENTPMSDLIDYQPHCYLSGIPSRYEQKRLANLAGYEAEKKRATEAIKAGRSVCLIGGCGSGKTHLACALLRLAHHIGQTTTIRIPESEQWGDHAKRYHFMSAVNFYLELKETFGDGDGTEKEIIHNYTMVHTLLLDDLGAEKVTDWSRQALYTLLDGRYREMRQTIITSNLSLDQLAQVLDDRIASRLLEMGEVITLKGGDYRLNLKV